LTRAQRDLHLYVPLRYYRRPRGTDDGHGYGKASRFLTDEVQALCRRTECTGIGAAAGGAAPATAGRRIDVSVDVLFR
jgi:DNA helicase-2/ATP-dependent DNA helicase PcrA